MGFQLFSDIFKHVDSNIVAYASEKATRVIGVIEPAVVTGMAIYILMYGWLHLKGQVEQPFMQFVDNVVKIGVIVGLALGINHYNTYVIDTFQNSPMALASAFSNSASSSATVSASVGAFLDNIMNDVFDTGMSYWEQGGMANIGAYLIASFVWAVGVILTVYTAFLIMLSKVYSGIMLALGPLFISALLFEKTKNYFANFLNTLIYSGFVMVLAVAAMQFILSLFGRSARMLAEQGGSSAMADLFALFITGGIGVLVLAQVTSIASSLGGGVQLSTMGVGRQAGGALSNAVGRAQSPMQREANNKRAAQDQLSVQRHKDKLVSREAEKQARRAPKNEVGGTTRKTGTNS